jgi:hypothetical protein
MARPTYTYVLPIRLALALAVKQKVPELPSPTRTRVILDNLSKGGRFSHRRVGVALPPGLRKHKDDVRELHPTGCELFQRCRRRPRR